MNILVQILLLLSVCCYSQSQQILTKYYSPNDMPSAFGDSNCHKAVFSEYSLNFNETTPDDGKLSKEQERINRRVNRVLEKRHGSNWETLLLDEILLCGYKNYHVNLGYKTMAEDSYEIGDKILCPEVIFYIDGGGGVHSTSYDSVELIVDFINSHPKLKVEIGFFTDQRGNEEYNFDWSNYKLRRLCKLMELKFGLDSEMNYTARGYGESEPLISPSVFENVKTSHVREEFYRMNRRMELKIIGVN